MSDSAVQAKASFQRWNAAFNARDLEAIVAEMHFPHRRLSGANEFQVWETADDFRESGGERTTAALKAEGWDHTTTTSIEAVQSGPDKVHLAINQSRRRADGTEYNPFPTLWVFTKINGRWGVQFRSSFVSGLAQGIGGGLMRSPDAVRLAGDERLTRGFETIVCSSGRRRCQAKP